MRILLDECLPRQLKRNLLPHDAVTVTAMGWSGRKNGALLRLAETQFDVLLTVDSNLAYQQNIADFDVAVMVMAARNNSIELLKPLIPQVMEALQTIQPGDLVRIGNKPNV